MHHSPTTLCLFRTLYAILISMTLALTPPTTADAQQKPAQDQSGIYDYVVLALSWSPNWCAQTGEARGAEQCAPDKRLGWILHGLWPQYETGYPKDCRSRYAPPTRQQTNAMADIMGSSGLAWHQWKKHGSCSGLLPQDYFALSRQAYNSVTRPAILRQTQKPVTLPATLIEQAFLQSNPQLSADGVTITCKRNYIQEVRICLNKDLTPRTCGADVIRDCTLKSAQFEPYE